MKRIIIFLVLCLVNLTTLFSQYKSKYPDIPIVDVHIHPRGVGDVANFIKVSELIKQKYGSNLAFWVGLNPVTESIEEVKAAGKNRILFAVGGLRPQTGLQVTAEEVIEKVQDGYVGLKFPFTAPYRHLQPGVAGITRIDDPRFAPFFSKLEKANILMASLHNADPNGPFGNRQEWMFDPVYFWEQIRAFENVLSSYPNLTIVAAHGAWLVCQDAQFDYLRYMLSTYPNLYIDISATCHYMHLSNRDNIRDFYIEYQDRILFGTDGGRIADNDIDNIAGRYANFFAILETDQLVNGTFFREIPTKGLDLPREALEKIYYRNARKLYPGLKEAMDTK